MIAVSTVRLPPRIRPRAVPGVMVCTRFSVWTRKSPFSCRFSSVTASASNSTRLTQLTENSSQRPMPLGPWNVIRPVLAAIAMCRAVMSL